MIHLTETDSTSNYLNTLSQKEQLEEFTVVMADFQTAGKGQRGNSWEAEAGKNLLFSFIMYPHFLPIREQFLLSKMVSLAIKETLEDYAADISIKWPNDIYWKDKKICGILIENDLLGSTIEKSIAGIGININQELFQSPAPNPVSLQQITGKVHSIEKVLASVMEKVQEYYKLLKNGDKEAINTRYHRALFRRVGYHLYSDKEGVFHARIRTVKDTGILVLEDNEGREREYAFKEVSSHL
ncbi:biotin--[acetyl-CoA-carboxylase] ligase [Bacteroides sp. 224]|uniref:biotin--[acetyl-CoA-carboxylase] ligase n=1 Tax=Bacteroides sp. 224 TaxID=2302936 RepID=UPI0013D6A3B5|nr:biotin--[acetyl-CoA-carboxylase] ligase [Bacteroides sp. 224]NDV66477.1 biotin--[acetyl-CoA-carboxylase] ligase [Bacteroides sp. 224]